MEQQTDVEHRLTVVEEQGENHERRITDVEKKQDNLIDLVTTVKILATREEIVESDVKEIKSDVKSLKDIPAKRWNSVIEKLLLVAAGAIGTYIMGRLGF